MLNFFIRKPVTTVMFVLFWVVLGLVSFPKMNIERTPSVEFPIVTSSFIYPGASPAEIESQVLKKAEDAVSEVAGLKKITSQAFENGGFVMTEFHLGVNVNDKASEVKSKLDAISVDFPSDVKKPVVEKLNPLQESVVDIVLSGGNSRDLEEYIDDRLSNKITALSGIASLSVFGGQQRAVRIQMNPELMTSRGVSLMDIVNSFGEKNINIPSGKIESGTDSSNVRFIGEFNSIEDIKNLGITTSEGQNFKLSEIANVSDAARDIDTGARYNSNSVVIISVIKASDGNAIKISKELKKHLPEFRKSLQDKFPNAKMDIISDSSISILNETNSALFGIILGLLFTIITLLLFSKNWRSTVVSGVVIPVSLVAGFFFMNSAGFTINSMTLLAYSSALGTLISNAIILIEAALIEMGKGKSPHDAAIDGTRKSAVSVLSGVGTNIVVFLPIAFMGGIAGQFMVQFGLTVVYLSVFSLMFSFTLTPMMIAYFLRLPKKVKVKKIKNVSKQMPRFRRYFDFQKKHPFRVLVSAFLILIASSFLMRFVGNEFSPTSDINEIIITARSPMGSTFEKSESIAKKIENKLKTFPEISYTSVKIGEKGTQNILIKVGLLDTDNRDISDKMLVQKILPELSEIPDAEIQVRAGKGMGGNSSDMVLNIYGEEDMVRDGYADQILKILNNIPEIQSAVLSSQKPNTELRFMPNESKMNFWGITNATAGATLRTAIYGHDNYKYKENGKEYPIILEFSKQFKTKNMFDSIYMNSKKGLVPISYVGKIEEVSATSNIYRLDKTRITEIEINLGKSTIGPVQKKIEARLSEIDWQSGYFTKFGGMSETQGETTGEIGAAFLLAVILTFMLLAAMMNSLVHPITIATSILTSFSGVFIMMFLSGTNINIAAMLAFVMLVGLVVNNNILIIEPAIGRIAKGENASDALWAELMDRKGMVLMTSIAIIAGMSPQLFSSDGLKSSMAAVIIGGMAASLLWTFMLTPAIFFIMEKLRNAKNKSSSI